MRMLSFALLLVASVSSARSIQREVTEVSCTTGGQTTGEYAAVDRNIFDQTLTARYNTYCTVCAVMPQPDKIFSVTREERDEAFEKIISWTGESEQGQKFSLVVSLPQIVRGPNGQMPDMLGGRGQLTIGNRQRPTEMECTVNLR